MKEEVRNFQEEAKRERPAAVATGQSAGVAKSGKSKAGKQFQELQDAKRARLQFEILAVNAEMKATFYKWTTAIFVSEKTMVTRE